MHLDGYFSVIWKAVTLLILSTQITIEIGTYLHVDWPT